MCGIAVQLRFPKADPESVARMTRALAHRGPDGEGVHADGPVAMGHRRLSIIDLAGGGQPMFNEDRSVAVVLNGEIYNYRELTEALRSRHRLRTTSDTEVLVHLYEDLGTAMLPRLRGMFAFAIWDARRRRLFAARDRFGKKPLLYARHQDTLWLASELRALVDGGAPTGGVDRDALADYLSLLYIPAPKTIWRGVRKLLPGHFLVADETNFTVQRYWAPPVPGEVHEAPPNAATRTRELLEESIRLRLRSDVPVGVLLSGGIDSSVVTALAATASPNRLKTFCIGFGEADDELPFARQIANRFGTDHHEVIVREDVVEATTRALSAFSEPFGDSSAVPSAEVFRQVAQQVKVVLTGDGGDEMFAGYGRYRQAAGLPSVPMLGPISWTLDRLPPIRVVRRAARATRALSTRGDARYRALVEVFSAREVSTLIGRRAALQCHEGHTDADRALAFDIGVYLPDDLLVKVDMTSMAWGLEARCPLLDHVLGDWVIPMPISAKQNRRRGKLLLHAAARKLLPGEVFSRPKRGFGSPVEVWLRGPLRALFCDTVMTKTARIRDWLASERITSVGARVLEGKGNGHQAWALLALEQWARNSQPVP
jgi:asparagine synthase (glutamine-hydrolysing)